MDLYVNDRSLGDYVVVEVNGELDLATAPTLRDHLLAVLNRQGARVILDLTGVDFMDSTGLLVLVSTERRARLLGGGLRLAAPGSNVLKVLRVTSLDRHFAIFPDAEAAAALT